MPIRSKEQFLVFGQPQIGTAEIDEVIDSMRRAWLGTGPKVEKFEAEFATWLGVKQVVSVANDMIQELFDMKGHR